MNNIEFLGFTKILAYCHLLDPGPVDQLFSNKINQTNISENLTIIPTDIDSNTSREQLQIATRKYNDILKRHFKSSGEICTHSGKKYFSLREIKSDIQNCTININIKQLRKFYESPLNI